MNTMKYLFAVMMLLCIAQLACSQYLNSVTISSQIDTGSDDILSDGGNVAALDIAATDGYDSGIDVPEPAPPVSNYISTYFPHPEWSSIFGDNFMVDVRNGNNNLSNTVKAYDFEIETDQNGEQVDLTFTIGSSYPASYGVVLYDTESAAYQNLREDNTYTYTAGSTVHEFSLRLGDATDPSITITYPTSGLTLLVNTAYVITWTYTDITDCRSTDLYYSLDNGSNWTSIGTASGGSTSYPWTTPGTISTEALIRVEAEDWAGNVGTATMSLPFTIAAGHMEKNFNSGWHLTSLPLIPPSTAIEDVFGDDVTGAYFVYDYTQSTGYNLVQNVNNGYGYWLALENSALIDVDGATAVNQVVVPLDLQWNIIGAAMAEAISRDALQFSNGVTAYNFVDAVNAGWISSAFYKYDNGTGSYTVASTLDPWYGYWLQALIAGLDVITDPPYDFAQSDPRGISSDEESWELTISVSNADLYSDLCAIGVYPDASSEYDLWWDLPSPPVPPSGDYLQIFFDHSEWSSPVGNQFCRDFRAPLEVESTETWVGILESSSAGVVEVSFTDLVNELPPDYWATAEINGNLYNLMEMSAFSVDCQGQEEITVLVSNQATPVLDDFSKFPEEFKLIGAYPNPFNPVTTISFALPVASHVSLSVFNLQGQLVSNLVNGTREAGLNEITFDGSTLASGLYMYRMEAGDFVSMRKMVLMK